MIAPTTGMEPYYTDDAVTIWHGDSLEVLTTIADCSIDAIVTDPPYGLEFMGKDWDGADGFRRSLNAADVGRESVFGRTSAKAPEYRTDSKATASAAQKGGHSATDGRPTFLGGLNPKCLACGKWQRGSNPCTCETPQWTQERLVRLHVFQEWCEQWAIQCLRVLKPGGHILAFGGSRTWHRLAAAIEDAGFEIRDSIAWIFGSGFPKSLNVGKSDLFCQCAQGELRHGPTLGIDPLERRWNHSSVLPVRDPRQAVTEPNQATNDSVLFLQLPVDGALSNSGCEPLRPHGEARNTAIRPSESGLEGRGDVQAEQGQLHRPEVRSMPSGSASDGTGRRLHHGAPAGDGSLGGPPVDAHRSGQSYQPHHEGQSAGESGSLADERGPQAGRGRPICGGCSKPRIPAGVGTALKPAFEPIVMGRKPLIGTVAANVLKHGTGALNIDACRIAAGQDYLDKCASVVGLSSNRNGDAYGEWNGVRADSASSNGRWPANVVLDEAMADVLDEQSGTFNTHGGYTGHVSRPRNNGLGLGDDSSRSGWALDQYGDSGGASRFFYVAKAPQHERPKVDDAGHPTVKPLDLMRWLIRLVTPPGGIVLDPFLGSGTTAEACLIEGFKCIGIEKDETSVRLAVKRLSKPIQVTLA